MSSSLPFLALPSLALLAVFTRLQASLRDVVALSSTCRELWSLGAAARRRHVCCAACGHRLLQASLALASDTHRQAPPHPRLPDGPAWAVDVEHALAPHGGCVLGEAELVREADAYFVRTELGISRAGDAGHTVRAQELRCGRCALQLGIRVTQIGRLRAGAVQGCIRYWRELQVLGSCYLARPYLRLRLDDGREEHLARPPASTAAATALYVCTGARSRLLEAGQRCGAPLFERRDVLSKQHRWDAGGGHEQAFFINALRPGAAVEVDEQPEELAQGRMVVSDVRCARCAAAIGWRFCRDLTPHKGNSEQVGRYGIVKSSMRRVKAAPQPTGSAAGGSDSGSNSGSDSDSPVSCGAFRLARF